MAIKKGVYYINGVERVLYSDPERDSLADVLRRYGLTGLKIGCGSGQCGSCTIILDGEPVRSCITKMSKLREYCEIETIEGIGTAKNLHPLQKAWIKYGGVQCGFCTTGFIMSAKALLDKDPHVTRQQVRDWFSAHNNLCRCTGYKPLVDAVMAAAAVMAGEADPSTLEADKPDGSIYSSRYPRPAALAKVLGAADFSGDINGKMPEGTLSLALKLTDCAHGRILAIDTAEAEQMPGVVKVITQADVLGTNNMGGAQGSRSLIKKDQNYVLHGVGMKVRRLGDAIAIIAARTEAEAHAAAEKIKVRYEELPVYENPLEACKPDAVSIVDGVPNSYFYQPVIRGEDPEKIFKQAETDPDIKVVEGSFKGSRQPHLVLERDAAEAFYDEEGVLTVVYKFQWVHAAAKVLAAAAGVDKIRCIQPPTGSSFGATVFYHPGAYVAVAEAILKQPVKLELSYAEKQLITGKRTESYANFKAAVNSEGKMLAAKYELAYESGAFCGNSVGTARKGARFGLGHYNCENHRGLIRVILSNNSYLTAYRGAGSPEMFTSSESIVDMMAEAIGMDPYEFRFKNIARPGDLTPNGAPFKLYPLEDMMNQFRPVYQKDLAWRNAPAEPGWKRGIGISLGGYHVSWKTDVCEVELELRPGGRIDFYDTWELMGQGGDIGSLTQVVEALRPIGMTADKVRLIQNDTRICPDSGLAGASRSHFMHGRATIDGANKLMNAMRKPDGSYRSYEEMVAEGIPLRYKGVDNTSHYGFTDLDDDCGQGDPMPDQNFILNIACVEVNEETGKTRVVSSHNIIDVGVVGNYLALEGQAYSGIFHSEGYALFENYSDFDKKYLKPLGCGFPRCSDVPDDFTLTFHQTPREIGPFGSGGASECFESCCHVSFLNAVSNALGIRIYEMPATPDKIKAAVAARKEGRDNKPKPYCLGDSFDDVMADIAAHPVTVKREVAGEC